MNIIELLLCDNRGIHIPRDFLLYFDLDDWHVPDDLRDGIESDSDWYWDNWEDVLDRAYYEHKGHKWHLYQNGDLWAMCNELMTLEEKQNFEYDIEISNIELDNRLELEHVEGNSWKIIDKDNCLPTGDTCKMDIIVTETDLGYNIDLYISDLSNAALEPDILAIKDDIIMAIQSA